MTGRSDIARAKVDLSVREQLLKIIVLCRNLGISIRRTLVRLGRSIAESKGYPPRTGGGIVNQTIATVDCDYRASAGDN